MRSNSGKDESENNMRDPTTRDRSLGRDVPRKHDTQTTQMGSRDRKRGQQGDR